ncbi:MAG: prolyl oligopeptidase family serine peptidase, partial [Myxococcota bacterium]
MPICHFFSFSACSKPRSQIPTGLLLVAVLGCASTAVDDTPKPTRQSAAILEESVCEFPFPDYAGWLAFMDEAKDPAWRAPAMRRLVDQVSYERFHQGDTVTCKRIVYDSDGLAIVGYALSPTRHQGKAPVVLFAHGGVAQWGRITFFDLLELHRLAERGYVVLASALRGEGGSEGSPNLGAGDLADTLRLIDVASEIETADTERLGFWGVSRGGALGYRVLATTERFDAALLVGAPSDLVEDPRRDEFHQHVYPGVVDGYEEDQDAALKKLSALYWADRLSSRTPILLLHGGGDERVRSSDSINMAEQLETLKRDHELIVFENGSHTLIEHLVTVREHTDRWFDHHLKASRGRTNAGGDQVAPKKSASTEIVPKRIALSFDDAPLGDGPVFSG